MPLSRTKPNDAAGRTQQGAAAASIIDASTDENDDAEGADVAQEYALLGHGFFAHSAASDHPLRGPTNELREN